MKFFRKALLTMIILAGCARAPVKSASEALRLAPMPANLTDDLNLVGLLEALRREVSFYEKEKKLEGTLTFGPRVVTVTDYVAALNGLIKALESDPTGQAFQTALKDNFEAFEVYGRDKWGEVFMTSYFEPVIQGSKKPTATFSTPLYSKPSDLVDIDFQAYWPTRPAFEPFQSAPLDQKIKTLRGRLTNRSDDSKSVEPYPSRAEIYEKGLQGVAKPLVYVDPIDAFILEIQGSGLVEVGKTAMNVTYAGQNGHPYVAIGRSLFDIIPKEKMTLFALENHLRSLPKEDAQKLMETNPSYVFFKKAKSRGRTYLGTELEDGRTVATDANIFPKGALAFLAFEKPVFASENASEPEKWEKTTRFVLDQDTGGAIRGAGRLDLFAGRGQGAKQMASVMKNTGRLIYFVPKIQASP